MSGRKPFQIAREEPRLVRQERGMNKAQVQSFLMSALQKLKDAQRESNSGPTRLEAAYDAMLMCGHAVFAAQKLRPTSEPGHHDAVLEGLAAELQLSQTYVDEIDSIKTIRHTKYTGLLNVSSADMKLALAHAQRVLEQTEGWFKANAADLLK